MTAMSNCRWYPSNLLVMVLVCVPSSYANGQDGEEKEAIAIAKIKKMGGLWHRNGTLNLEGTQVTGAGLALA